MRSPRLTPGKASLLMLGIGTASLIGLPGMSYEPPEGSLVGVVSDPEGNGLEDVPVALFDAESLALVEIAHTDPHGRFALQQAPESFHVCAYGDPARGWLPTWSLDLERGPLFTMDLSLRRGRWLDVAVTDDDGEPLEGADVRVYGLDRRDAEVVARTRTDATGHARVLAAETSHVGVFPPTVDELPAWAFFVETQPAGTDLALRLPRGRRLHGRVRAEDGEPVSGAIVSAWDRRETWQWNGYRRAAEDGAFAIYAGAGTTEVRALDLAQDHLPVRMHAGPTPTLDLVMPEGVPVEVVCESSDGDPVPARVWVWSEESQTWSWGTPTGDDGRIAVRGSAEGFDAVAEPLSGLNEDPHAWRAERNPQALRLIREAQTD